MANQLPSGRWRGRTRDPRTGAQVAPHKFIGGAITFVGVVIAAVIVGIWIERGFGALSDERAVIAAATLIIVGIQVFFSSFLLSILGLRRRG